MVAHRCILYLLFLLQYILRRDVQILLFVVLKHLKVQNCLLQLQGWRKAESSTAGSASGAA